MYIIKQSFCGDVSFLLQIRKKVPEWVSTEKYARTYTSKRAAENAIGRIAILSPNVGALEVVKTESKKKKKFRCNLDCFHCPYPDCRNNSASRSEWEKAAMRCARMDD